MKSLRESLFDSKTQTTESLFDNDLVSRDIKFGDLYEFEYYSFSGANAGYYAFDNLMVSKLKRDFGGIPSILHASDCKTNFIDNKDKQSRNRTFIANILFYLINEFDMSMDIKNRMYKFYYHDAEVNEILSKLCGYLSSKLYTYRIGDRSIYINANYNETSKNITIMIGKYQTRGGFNPHVNFVFKKK